jgi:hypothetical protein
VAEKTFKYGLQNHYQTMGDCRESGWWLKKLLNAAFKITTIPIAR